MEARSIAPPDCARPTPPVAQTGHHICGEKVARVPEDASVTHLPGTAMPWVNVTTISLGLLRVRGIDATFQPRHPCLFQTSCTSFTTPRSRVSPRIDQGLVHILFSNQPSPPPRPQWHTLSDHGSRDSPLRALPTVARLLQVTPLADRFSRNFSTALTATLFACPEVVSDNIILPNSSRGIHWSCLPQAASRQLSVPVCVIH